MGAQHRSYAPAKINKVTYILNNFRMHCPNLE